MPCQMCNQKKRKEEDGKMTSKTNKQGILRIKQRTSSTCSQVETFARKRNKTQVIKSVKQYSKQKRQQTIKYILI